MPENGYAVIPKTHSFSGCLSPCGEDHMVWVIEWGPKGSTFPEIVGEGKGATLNASACHPKLGDAGDDPSKDHPDSRRRRGWEEQLRGGQRRDAPLRPGRSRHHESRACRAAVHVPRGPSSGD